MSLIIVLLVAILAVLCWIAYSINTNLFRVRRNQRRWLPRPGTTIQEDEW